MDDPPPTDLAARRAERARCNGARSRGPVTERGKARSSRNALRHGLTAKVHLVLDRDDEAEFMALAAGLEGELAPRSTLEGFLVARLTAAMWHTGRAERMEARAFAAAPDPDPDRLRLALRYRGSVQRELFRCLRALQELRCRPLASLESDAGGTAEPERSDAAPELADPVRVAIAAWGGERAGTIPPGFLELRPVPQVWPIAWRFVQNRAFPGDVPLLVYADGTVRSPEGRLLEDVWSPEASPSPPAESAAPPPTSASTLPPTAPATTPAPARSQPMSPEPAPVLAAPPPEPSALDWLDGEADELDVFDLLDDLPTYRRLRNEPTQPLDSARILVAPQPLDADTATPRIGFGRTPPDLNMVPPYPDAVVEPENRPLLPAVGAERQDDHGPPPPGLPAKRARMIAWERMWGIKLPESELSGTCDDTSEPEAARPQEQICTNELPPRTSEPDTENSEPPVAEVNSEVEDRADPVRIDIVERLDDRHSDQPSSSTGGWRRDSSPRGRIRRRHFRTLPAGPPE